MTSGQPPLAERDPAPRRPSNLSSLMLDELLNDTLDPGYRAAAAHRDAGTERRWWDGPVVWLACVAVGLLLVVAYQQSHQSAPSREAARQELIKRIQRLQDSGASMDAEAKKLAAQVAALRDAQLATGDPGVRQLEVNSGSVAVSGPGMEVQLGEPPAPTAAANGRPGTTPQTQVAVIHDKDIRAVVNQLWAAGAEAVAVNGLRLSSTSFIRFAGESVLVDFQPISPPYSVQAIGNRNGLQVAFADSAIARQLTTMAAVDGISFRFSGRDKLQLPSVTVTQPHYAERGAAGSQPSSSTSRPSHSPSPTSTESPR